MSTTTQNGNWTKLTNGNWGVRYFSGKAGETITVEKRDGTTSQIELVSEITTGEYTIMKAEKQTTNNIQYTHRTREDWQEIINEQDCNCEHYVTRKRPCDCGEEGGVIDW